MKKVGINLAVLMLAFLVGVVSWLLNPFSPRVTESHEPLAITITQDVPASLHDFGYIIKVRNQSDKTIRGFSLGHACGCRSWDSDGNPYPQGTNFTNPVPEFQVLGPGQTLEIPMTLDSTAPQQVWADLVHFEDGTNWGPNRGHKEGYVRE